MASIAATKIPRPIQYIIEPPARDDMSSAKKPMSTNIPPDAQGRTGVRLKSERSDMTNIIVGPREIASILDARFA